MNTYWGNLIAWCIQVAIVAAVCAAIPFVFRLKASRGRLWYWHIVLLACLALPLLQPWVIPPISQGHVTVSTGQFRVAAAQAPAGFRMPWGTVAVSILAGGVLLRILWLGLGLLRLRRYRTTAIPLQPEDDHFADLRSSLAPSAEILFSTQVTSPVTFGVRRAVILLPVRFRDLGLEERRSIVCHELMHIQRRDWAVAIAEEIVRSVTWFHPAIWWLLGKIQLTREQVVDEAVIQHTGDRNRYLDALLAIASLRLSADLAPAPLFLKKRHLRQRVESIVSGVTMTKRNLLLPLAAALASLPVVIGIAAWQFPLRAASQEVIDDQGVDLQLGAAKVLHRSSIPFPEAARSKHVSGTVVASVTVDEKGEVSTAQAVSGPDALRKAVVQSVLNWHFAMDSSSAPRTFDVAVRFDAGQPPPSAPGKGSAVPVRRPAPAMTPRTIDSISLDFLPTALRDKVAQANVIHIGDVISKGPDIEALEAQLREIDDHLRLGLSFTEGNPDKMRVTVRLVSPPSVYSAAPQGMAPISSDSAALSAPGGIRVGGNVQSANLIEQAKPAYPPMAKQARIQGTVRFNVVIAQDGTMKNIQVISGHPMLVQAALEAVKQWRYKPTLLNGNPVEVITTVDVNFTLSDTPPPPAEQ